MATCQPHRIGIFTAAHLESSTDAQVSGLGDERLVGFPLQIGPSE